MPDDWLPPATNINALPAPLRSYIHQLKTNAEPAGTIRELILARDLIRQLEAALRERDGNPPFCSRNSRFRRKALLLVPVAHD